MATTRTYTLKERIDRAFEKKFRFLYLSGVGRKYIMILGMARTVTELQTLHDQLPQNERLNHDDYKDFQNFWEEFLKVDGTEPRSSDVFQWLTEEANHDIYVVRAKGFFEYYMKILQKKKHPDSERINRHFANRPSVRARNEDYLTDSQTIFKIGLFGQRFTLVMSYCDDPTMILADIVVHSEKLTEEITHRLYSLPIYSYSDQWRNTGDYVIWLGYVLDATSLKKEMLQVKTRNETIMVIQSKRFLTQLTELLKAEGLPLEGEVTLEQESRTVEFEL